MNELIKDNFKICIMLLFFILYYVSNSKFILLCAILHAIPTTITVIALLIGAKKYE